MCEHSPMYRIENEQAGGIGCPLCNIDNCRKRSESCGDNEYYEEIPFDGSIPLNEDEEISQMRESADSAL